MQERIKELINKEDVLIFLKNNFRFQGKVLKVNDNFIEFHGSKTNKIKLIALSEISQIDYE